jgi:hypothetical protein
MVMLVYQRVIFGMVYGIGLWFIQLWFIDVYGRYD